MVFACWSVKGGSGTTVVSVALAALHAEQAAAGALLVDLCGDAPAVLGMAPSSGTGIDDWLAAGDGVPADALARLEVPAPGGIRVLPGGPAPAGTAARAGVLAALLAADPRPVVVDCGADPTGVALAVVGSASCSLLVLRPCFLALRRAQQLPARPSGVVLVTEPGRALGPSDVEAVVDAPVVAVVRTDPAVARAVDAGLLGSRLPRSLARALRHVG